MLIIDVNLLCFKSMYNHEIQLLITISKEIQGKPGI